MEVKQPGSLGIVLAPNPPGLARLRPILPHVHQVATGPLPTPASAQIVTLIEKCPVAVRIGTHLYPPDGRPLQHLDPGSGDLREHDDPTRLQSHLLKTQGTASTLYLLDHRGQGKKDIKFF